MQSLLESLNNSRKMGEHISTSRWLNAHEDRSAGVKIFSGRYILLCDISNTGDYGLIIAEPKITKPNESSDCKSSEGLSITGRLRVYKGAASLCSERPLQGPPTALVAFYTDEFEPRIPAVAVAIGTDILIYKNNKPFFKWSTPATACTALEQEIWRRLVNPDGHGNIKEQINSLKTIAFNELSPRSQKLLILAGEKLKDSSMHIEEYIGRYIHAEAPVRSSIITSMAVLNKNSLNMNATACLVIATENNQLYVLDPVAFTIIHQALCSSQTNTAPTHIACSGQFDIDYRIIIACRDKSVWLLRRGWLEARRLITATLGGPTVECLTLGPENMIVVAGRKKVGFWSKKGKFLYTIKPEKNDANIYCICQVPLPHLNTCLLAVGVNSQIHFYQNRTLVDIISLPDQPAALKFGRLGQEDNVLIITTKEGALLFKILKRTAEFTSATSVANDGTLNNPALINKPLPLPKRSKLFAEQSQRERNNAKNIHQTFQQGLIRLRLIAARNTVSALNSANCNISENAKHPIKLSAQVLGLGPKFTLTLTLENLSSENIVANLKVLLHVNITKYRIECPYFDVPMIPPDLKYKIETSVTEIIDSSGLEDCENAIPIRVFVLIPENVRPILAASINMPPTDPLAFLV